MNVSFSSVGWWHKISRDTETTIASKKSALGSSDKIGDFKRYVGAFLENNKSMSIAERQKIQNIISKFDGKDASGDDEQDDDSGLGLCFGDAILLEFLQNEPAPGRKAEGDSNEWGFLAADITRSGHVGMSEGTVDKPPRDIGDCLWTVEPVYQHCAYRELRAYMSEVRQNDWRNSSTQSILKPSGSSRSNDVDPSVIDAEKKRLKRALVQEIRFNNKLAMRRKGDPIAFGQPVLCGNGVEVVW